MVGLDSARGKFPDLSEQLAHGTSFQNAHVRLVCASVRQ